MKKQFLLLFIFIFGMFSSMYSQKNRITHEKFKALKTAFITDELDLTVKEAELFWPIYNEYHKASKTINFQLEHGIKKQIDNNGGIENLTDIDATKILKKIILLKKQKAKISEQLYPRLRKVISAKKIIRLTKAERDFRFKIFREYRRRGSKK